jgi:hypothetical protein
MDSLISSFEQLCLDNKSDPSFTEDIINKLEKLNINPDVINKLKLIHYIMYQKQRCFKNDFIMPRFVY